MPPTNLLIQAELLVPNAAHLTDFRRRIAAQSPLENSATGIARAQEWVGATIQNYWRIACETWQCQLPLRPNAPAGSHGQPDWTKTYAEQCAQLPVQHAAFAIGELYTSLLPKDHRAKFGIYYTPPSIVEALIDRAGAAGVDWRTAEVLDPACGGAAFLANLASQLLKHNESLPTADRLQDVADRLCGYEIDPFAAWLSAVLLDATLLPLCAEVGWLIRNVVQTTDALQPMKPPARRFDLVIGNPPYGRVRLAPESRELFHESLHGHANLYGLFTHQAVRWTKPEGVIAFITPASFLGGEYFKNLRRLLAETSPPVGIGFLHDRSGVFEDVLQETVLALFKRSPTAGRAPAVTIDHITVDQDRPVIAEPIGSAQTSAFGAGPWILPRDRVQGKLLAHIDRLPCRLGDLGVKVSTGPLVWNRHRDQLRLAAEVGALPLIWAESILPNGLFSFRAEKKNHAPYVAVTSTQHHLIIRQPAVLVQRTTSKEQCRRVIAALLPDAFLNEHGGCVIENHVNVITATNGAALPLELLCRVLNSATIDQLFRCISGSVAVSAFELNALPLPTPSALLRLSSIVDPADFDQELRKLFQHA